MKRTVLYDRPTGPVCYRIPLIGSAISLQSFVTSLVDSGLSWWWESALSQAPHEVAGLHRRDWTSLTRRSASDLAGDYSERDEDGCGRFIALIGLGNEPLSDTTVHALLTEFIEQPGVRVKSVILEPGDTIESFFFVPGMLGETHRGLLHAWGVDTEQLQTKPYSKLRTAALEEYVEVVAERSRG